MSTKYIVTGSVRGTISRPTTSRLSLAEWRAAFRVRACLHCGEKITPSERTLNPATARRIVTCSKACESARTRSLRTPEQREHDAALAAARFARWSENPENYRKHIARTAARRKDQSPS